MGRIGGPEIDTAEMGWPQMDEPEKEKATYGTRGAESPRQTKSIIGTTTCHLQEGVVPG